jgi:endonuclease YncB( thermonuclease family)
MGRRRADSATVIEGDTIVVGEQLVSLHGIDAPELDRTFWWRVSMPNEFSSEAPK